MTKFNSLGILEFSKYLRLYFSNNKFLMIYLDGKISGSFNLKNFPENIFDWTEEELFYFSLKYC